MDKIFSAVADSMGSDKSVLIFMFDGKKRKAEEDEEEEVEEEEEEEIKLNKSLTWYHPSMASNKNNLF